MPDSAQATGQAAGKTANQNSDPASNQNKTRPLKQLVPEAVVQDNLAAFLDFLNFLSTYDYQKQNAPIPSDFIQDATAKELQPAFSNRKQIKQIYASEQFDQYLLPGDIIALLRDALVSYQTTYQKQLNSLSSSQKRAQNQAPAELSAVLNLLEKSFTDHWPNNQITQTQDLKVAQKLIDKKTMGALVARVGRAIEQTHDLVSTPHPAEPEQPDQSTAADQLGPAGPAAAKAKRSSESETPTQEPQAQETQDAATAFLDSSQDLNLLATSFSYTAVNAILAAYATDENGQPLLDVSHLSDELRQALFNEIRPQVENIIAGLTPNEIQALINNTAQASAVRTKILKQTHSHILRSPAPRLLLQQAFNERFGQLDENQAQKLSQALEQNGHEEALQQLTQFANQEGFRLIRPLSLEKEKQVSVEEQTQALNRLREITTNYQARFSASLGSILGKDLSGYTNLSPLNINRTLTMLVMADPTLSPDFIDNLNHTQFSILFGDFVSPEEFARHELRLKQAFKQYCILHRAQLNQTNPELAALSSYQRQRQPLTPEQLEETTTKVAQIRTYFKQNTDLDDEEIISSLSRKEATKEGEERRDSYIQQFKHEYWTRLSIEQKRDYLKEVGFADEAGKLVEEYAELTNQQLNQFLAQQQQEFDLFTHFAIEAQKAQQEAMGQIILATQQQAMAQQQGLMQQALLMQAVLNSSHFYHPKEGLAEGGGGEGATYQYQPAPTDQALQQASAIKELGGKALGFLANKGVDAALIAATGGTWATLPKPVRDLLISETFKKLKAALAFLGGLAAAFVTALVAALQNAAILASILAGAGAGAIIGSFFPAIGTGLGAVIGGTLGGLSSWLGIGTKTGRGALSSTTATDSLRQGAQNFRSATGSIGQSIASQVKEAVAGTGKSLLQAAGEGIGAGARTIGEFFASTPAAPIVAGYTAVSFVGAWIAINTPGAFLIDLSTPQPELLSEGIEFSPYAEVVKEASPSSIDNSTPTQITYTITISPKDNYQILVNLEETSDTFTYLGEKTPDIPNQTLNIINQISSEPFTEPQTITYQISDVSGEDAFVINKFKLVFQAIDPNTNESFSDTITTSANLTIGNPKVGCFEFGSSGFMFPNQTHSSRKITSSWSESEKNRVIESFAKRAGTSPMFVSLLCGSNDNPQQPLTIYRLSGSTFGGWAPSVAGGSMLGLYDAAFNNPLTLEYTFIHELGHIIDYRSNSQLNRQFAAVNTNPNCFTYPFPSMCSRYEAFAEAVALYVVHNHLGFKAFGGSLYNFPQKDPTEYNWIKDNIFGGVEF
jgi:hypothetical protein